MADADTERDWKVRLADDLLALQGSYQSACDALEVFVAESFTSIAENKSKHEEILRKLRSTPDQVDAQDRPPDIVRVSLTKGQVDLLDELLSGHIKVYDVHPQMLLDMALSHAFALFDAFLSDVLFTALCAKPQQLRSKATLTFEQALAFPSQRALIEELARRKVLAMMYGSLEDQLEYLHRAFRVDLANAKGVDLERLSELRDRRNLIVHNNGRASADYAARYGAQVGQRLSSSPEEAELDRELLSTVAKRIVVGVADHLCPGV